ncbi:MAG: hypothetical protein ACJ8G2_14115 [Burkholderiales bacterium]|jgi:hypothetical protein
MKIITAVATVLSFAAASTSFAGQTGDQGRQAQAPVEMTDAQMDNVTGGALINVFLVDVADVNGNNIQVAIPVNAAVAAGVLGGAIGTATQLGRQRAVQ